MKIKRFLLPLLIAEMLINLTGCSAILLSSWHHDNVKERITVMQHPQKQKEIIFIPMVHVGYTSTYQQINKALDSLRNQGYLICYEGVKLSNSDSLRLDTLQRKFRKIVGMHLSQYSDKSNKNLPKVARRIHRKSNYTAQTNALIGIDTLRDVNLDLSLSELIAVYEKKHQQITLTQYDWSVPLGEKYRCQHYGELHDLLHTFRNQYIMDYIQTSTAPKVVLVYGSKHFFWLYPKLLNAGFQHIRGRNPLKLQL